MSLQKKSSKNKERQKWRKWRNKETIIRTENEIV